MMRILSSLMLVLIVASCSSDNETTASTVAVVAAAGTDSVEPSPPAVTSGQPEITASPTVSVPAETNQPTPPTPVVTLAKVTSDCGPADGNWVEGSITSSEMRTVFAQLSVDGVTYGRSEAVLLEAGVESTIGFDPRRPPEAFGKTGRFEVLVADTETVIAEADVVLALPDGVSCG